MDNTSATVATNTLPESHRETDKPRAMKRILVTAATGQGGSAVIDALHAIDGVIVFAGVRDVAAASSKWRDHAIVQIVAFDFLDRATQDASLAANCDSMFLLRPPQLNGDFGDLIVRAQQHGVEHIVFLSVQPAERNRFIPHHKIEQRLMWSGVPYTLLRPAYLMQNFTSTLHADLTRWASHLLAGRECPVHARGCR